jgi:hypothetical protein
MNAMFYLDSALNNHYEDLDLLFEAYEEARNHPRVIELIDYYKK